MKGIIKGCDSDWGMIFKEVRKSLSRKSEGWGMGTLQVFRKEATVSAKSRAGVTWCVPGPLTPWAWGRRGSSLLEDIQASSSWLALHQGWLDSGLRGTRPRAPASGPGEEFTTILGLFTTCQRTLGRHRLFLITSFFRATYNTKQLNWAGFIFS